MKVLITLVSGARQISGVQRHAINLVRCLLARPEITEINIVAAPWEVNLIEEMAPHGDARLRQHIAPIVHTTLSRNWWFYSQLPKLANRVQVDLVHLAYPVPIRLNAFRCPVVVTLHDMYAYDIPENFGFPKVLFNQAALRLCLGTVDAIACVSQTTLSRLTANDARLAREKAVVIYNSVEAQPWPRPFRADSLDGISPPFILCVAQHRRNKNILLALRVFERLLYQRRLGPNARMLILGIEGPETPAIKSFLAASCLTHRVVLSSGISDAELQWCYRNCELLFVPSMFEGFGLPMAEALLAGCRVVCSDIPAFREIGGNYCVYVPLGPDELNAFSNAICSALMQDAPHSVSLPQLSVPIIAEQYLRLYRSLTLLPLEAENLNRGPFHSPTESRPL